MSLEASSEENVSAIVRELAERAKEASRGLAAAPTARKNAALLRAAEMLEGEPGDAVLKANAEDVAAGEEGGLSKPLLDRLRLDRARLDAVAEGVRQVAALPDPVGEIEEMRSLENGLQIGRMRAPLGVVGFIYESRPNVTADASALCIKSGNAILLRGGKEAFRSNQAIARIFASALEHAGLSPACATLIPTTDRHATKVLIGLDGVVDLIIPRGGEGLIRFVTENARVPVIQHFKGVCHVYVDGDADLVMAREIALNAKVHRPSVCNAMETLLVDETVAEKFLPEMAAAFAEAGVEMRGDARTCQIVSAAKPAGEEDWDAEYLDLITAVAVVEGIDGALDHVARYGSRHTEAIVTSNYEKARRWTREVDASLVLVNASTRFNDGYQLGLGAEIGISTTKLHAYGPMGLRELCTLKWIGFGGGQVRQ